MIHKVPSMVQALPPSRQPTQQDKDDLLLPLVGGIQELLFAPVNPFNDRPGFIAGPPPESGLARAVHGLTRLNCRLYATRDKSTFSPRVNQYNGEVCGPYLDSIGENPDGGFVGPEFTGGQCPEVYVVTYRALDSSGGPTTGMVRAVGPIGGMRIGLSESGAYLVEMFCSGMNFSAPSCGPLQNTGPGFYWVGLGGSSFNGGRASVVSASPCGLDNCGDPAPVVQPPGTVTPTTPIVPTIEIDLPGVGPVTINIDLGDDGRPIITAPALDISVEVEPTFGGGGDGGAPPVGPPPGDIGSPGAGGSAGNEGDAEGEAPPGSVLVGLQLNLTTIPDDANDYEPGVYRGVCYVYMGVPGKLDHDPVGAMVRDGQFCFAEKDNLTAWRVSANSGYVINVIPYYRSVGP